MEQAGISLIRTSAAAFLVSFSCLLTELLLVRVADALLGYRSYQFIVTYAMFGFGTAGIVLSRKSIQLPKLFHLISASAVALLLIRPLFNSLPSSDAAHLTVSLLPSYFQFIIYSGVVALFLLYGIVQISLLAAHMSSAGKLYGANLIGSACACLFSFPLIKIYGPGGLLVWSASLMFTAALLITNRKETRFIFGALAAASIAYPLYFSPASYDFYPQTIKRSNVPEGNVIEGSYWDPISKIDVLNLKTAGEGSKLDLYKERKYFLYDGGNQGSDIPHFNGDFKSLARSLEKKDSSLWNMSISHYLKRRQSPNVLILGCGGGAEVLSALTFNAAHVDAIDLVEIVIELVKGRYADYTGNIFNNPRVNAIAGEARSFLNSTDQRYDIIQSVSNFTTSSLGNGYAAMNPAYLHTVEAYRSYFRHLSENGILHINYPNYPRIITTAAAAWASLGRTDFQSHVVVMERDTADKLPTILIKANPWTQEELSALRYFAERFSKTVIAENPLHPERSFLSSEFYSGKLSDELKKRVPYRILPATDDLPNMRFLVKQLTPLAVDANRFVSASTATYVNEKLLGMHIAPQILGALVTSGTIILLFIMAMFFPFVGASAAKTNYYSVVGYFSCLGAGFIIFELALIQIFERVIGFPIYTVATIISTLLAGAGIGSILSQKIKRRPFAFILCLLTTVSVLVLVVLPMSLDYLLSLPVVARIIIAGAIVTPMGFALGIPFPLGLRSLPDQKHGVASAWTANSIFTAAGGLAYALLSMFFGFRAMIVLGLGIYVLAALLYRRFPPRPNN